MVLQMTTKGMVADLCFAGFFFPQKSVCLKGRALGGGGVFDLLIHSSNGHSSQAEARNSILAAHPWAILCCLAMHIRRELAQNPVARTQTSTLIGDAGAPGSSLTSLPWGQP